MYYDYYLYYLSYLSSMYNGYPFVVQMTVIMVMGLAILTLFAVVRLLHIGFRIQRKDKRRSIINQRFAAKCEFVLSNENNYDVEEVKELLDVNPTKLKKWEKEAATELLLALRDALDQEGQLNVINYKNCLACFALIPFWEKRIKHAGRIDRKVALQKIASLDNGLNGGLLSKSVYHRDKHLRKAARNIYTDQETYHPFRFMEDNFDESFDQLDKVRLHATLVKRSYEGKLPNLLRWVTNSKNSNYISFIIREMGFFEQYESAPNMVALLGKYENKHVRVQLVHTLGKLGYTACIPQLIERYELESNAVRQAIVETLGLLRNDQALDFLLESYENTEDNHFKIIIARAIKHYGKKGDESLTRLEQSAADDEKLIIKQVFAEKLVLTT